MAETIDTIEDRESGAEIRGKLNAVIGHVNDADGRYLGATDGAVITYTGTISGTPAIYIEDEAPAPGTNNYVVVPLNVRKAYVRIDPTWPASISTTPSIRLHSTARQQGDELVLDVNVYDLVADAAGSSTPFFRKPYLILDTPGVDRQFSGQETRYIGAFAGGDVWALENRLLVRCVFLDGAWRILGATPYDDPNAPVWVQDINARVAGLISRTSAEAIDGDRLVRLNASNELEACGASERPVGVISLDVLEDDDNVKVVLLGNSQAVVRMTASGTVGVGEAVYTAPDGKAQSLSTVNATGLAGTHYEVGHALGAATDGQSFDVQPINVRKVAFIDPLPAEPSAAVFILGETIAAGVDKVISLPGA